MIWKILYYVCATIAVAILLCAAPFYMLAETIEWHMIHNKKGFYKDGLGD